MDKKTFTVTFTRTYSVQADDWTKAQDIALDNLITDINEWGVSQDVFDIESEEI